MAPAFFAAALLALSVASGTHARAQESVVTQALSEKPVQVFRSETTVPKNFLEIIGFREYFIPPGEPAQTGFMIQAEYGNHG